MPVNTIQIKFSHSGEATFLRRSTYPCRANSHPTDSLNIHNNIIEIIAPRSSTPSNPLQAHNSTIVKQVVKALCFYYILESRANQIQEVTVTRTKGSKALDQKLLEKTDLRQVVSQTTDLSILGSIAPEKAEVLLSESLTGRAVLYAATHLIQSLDASSPFDRFEKLWRAFNALYRAFAKKRTDHECHVALRNQIHNNPSLFPLSIAKVSPLKATDIRSHIRWNQMILNNHATQKQTTALKDSIIRNSDRRILEIYQASLPVRQAFLTNAGLYDQVNMHIQNGIAANTTRDSDVLSTICIKYMYFVRNKIAHAEKADHGFSFLHGGAEEAEIRWLTPFLEVLVIDLINISDTF